MSPEVLKDHEGTSIAHKNTTLIERLIEFDVVIVAGQAKSHCVAWTIDDLLHELSSRQRELVKKVYLLEDCTSPVVVPGVVDFTEPANEAFRRFADAGMNLVKSTESIASWPGMNR